MRSLVGFSALLGLSLFLTVSLKVSWGYQVSLDQPNFTLAIVDFFAHHGYRVQSSPGEPIEANLGECQIFALAADPAGGSGARLRLPISGAKDDNGQDRFAFVFDGQMYEDQPTLRTVLQHLLTRVQLRLKMPGGWKPVLALRMSSSCSIDELPWREIARLPQS